MRHFRIAGALAMLLALLSGSPRAAVDSQAGRYYEDALARYEKRDLAGAIIQLKNALQQDRTMLSAQLLLGKALLGNGEVAAAEVALNEALRLGVSRSEVVEPLARALIEQGKPQAVLEGREFSLDGLPNPVRFQLLLLKAGAQADLGDSRGALKAIADARVLDASSPDSWLAEVPIRIRGKSLDEASAAVERALVLAPQSADAWQLKASILHVRGDLAGALNAYDRALELRAGHVEARLARAGIYLDLNRNVDATADVAELLKQSPREPRAAYLRAQIAERSGDRKAAAAALHEVTALIDPVPPDFIRYRPQLLLLNGLAHFTLGERTKAAPYLKLLIKTHGASPASKLLAQIHLMDREARDAADVLDSYLRLQPADPQAMMLMASAQLAQGRSDKATVLMEEALKLQDSPEFRTLLGMGLLQSGRGVDALEALETAFRANPALTSAGVPLVGIYLRSGHAAKAVATADTLLKKHPDSAAHWNLLGMARAGAHDLPGARKAFEKALALKPDLLGADLNLLRIEVAEKNHAAADLRQARLLKSHERNIDVLLAAAQADEFRGRLADAQRQIEKARDLEGNKQYGAALALMGFHQRQRRADLALEAVKGALAKAPDDYGLLVLYAQAQLAVGDAASARPALTHAGRAGAFDVARLVAVARLQLVAGDLSGAGYSLDKALSTQPDDFTAQALMTEVELRQGETGRAERRARELAAKHPRRAVGFALQGDVASAKGALPAALEFYRKAHQVEPSTLSVLKQFLVLERSGDPRAAVALAEQWVKGKPDDLAVLRALADAHARQRNFTKAKGAYEAILKKAPSDVAALNNLANVLLLQRQAPQAVMLAEKALALAPGDPSVIDTLGWALHQAGNSERALATLRDARLRDPNNPDIRFHLAVALDVAGRRDEARQEVDAAINLGKPFGSLDEARALQGRLK